MLSGEGTIQEVIAGRARWCMIRGDSLAILSAEEGPNAIPEGCVDALVTDCPYSSGGLHKGDRAKPAKEKYVKSGCEQVEHNKDFAGDNRDQRSFVMWVSLWLIDCLRLAKSGATAQLFIDWRQLPAMTDAFQCGGWLWRGLKPWDKGGSARPQLGRPRAQCEYIVWGSKGDLPLTRDVGVLPGLHTCHVDHREKKHMTGKPIELMREVNAVCEPGGLILDPFAGSGSTGVAAMMDGFRFIGIEKVAEHYETAREWLAETCAATDPKPAHALRQASLFV